jgi:phenylacetate-CoA ligase
MSRVSPSGRPELIHPNTETRWRESFVERHPIAAGRRFCGSRAVPPWLTLCMRRGVLPDGCRPRRLRIAIVAPSRHTLGGQAVQAERLIAGWRGDPGVDAWLVPIDPQPQRFGRRLAHVRYARSAVAETIYLSRLRRDLADADAVHVFSRAYSWFHLACVPAIIAARSLGKPVVLHYHHGEAPDHLERSPLSRAVLARVDTIVVPSAFLQEVFATFGLTTVLVPNVMNTERIPFRLRKPLKPRLLSMRNLHALYNVDCTLRMFQLVQQQYPDATLTILGSGPCEPSLRALADSLQLRHVHFAGRVTPEAIPEVLQRHDIYVQTPDMDNVPNSIMEAFASGMPVVATTVGGVPEMTAHGRLAMLAPRNDHRMLAQHVVRLLRDQQLAQRLALEARREAERHAWADVRLEWLDVYNGLAVRGEEVGPRPSGERLAL